MLSNCLLVKLEYVKRGRPVGPPTGAARSAGKAVWNGGAVSVNNGGAVSVNNGGAVLLDSQVLVRFDMLLCGHYRSEILDIRSITRSVTAIQAAKDIVGLI